MKRRKIIIQDHVDYIKDYCIFSVMMEECPVHLRNEMLQWGYPKDEYLDNDHWSPQLYIRESRRMTGEYVMTEANCTGKLKVTDGIGLAAYTMDSHNCQRVVVNGMVKNEGDVQVGGFPPYPVSYRSIVPETIRMYQPVWFRFVYPPVILRMGPSGWNRYSWCSDNRAAAAAAMAIDNTFTRSKNSG